MLRGHIPQHIQHIRIYFVGRDDPGAPPVAFPHFCGLFSGRILQSISPIL